MSSCSSSCNNSLQQHWRGPTCEDVEMRETGDGLQMRWVDEPHSFPGRLDPAGLYELIDLTTGPVAVADASTSLLSSGEP